MAILKVDTITSADTPTVSITDGASISGVTTFSSDINIADKIVHTGDTNTAIRFPGADTVSVETAGQQNVQVTGDRILLKSPSGTDTTVRLQHQGNSGYGDISLDRTVNAFIIDNDPGNAGSNGTYFSVKTIGSERLRITSAGLVGIGTDTSASSCKLQVVEPDSTECYIQVANQTTGYDGNSGLLIGYNGSEVAKFMNLENTAMDIGTNGNNRISIANDGHVTLSNAISFNAETATANRLDDYEEGTWTGTIVTGGGNVTNAWYTKIGNIVFVTGNLSAWGDTTSGTAITVSGFPFTCSATAIGTAVFCKHSDAQQNPWIEVSSTTGTFLHSSTSTGSCDYMYHSGIVQSSGSAAFSVWYKV